jgi:hypothetical protein
MIHRIYISLYIKALLLAYPRHFFFSRVRSISQRHVVLHEPSIAVALEPSE